MKKLPLGIQTFRKIIEDDALYIDKTKAILDLIENGSVYFLSRPRRFGKSLLLSTLKEIFSGSQDLFKGLYIHDKIEWKKHPVIHIDFSFITYDKGVEVFEKSLDKVLTNLAKQYSIQLEKGNLKDRFGELIQKMAVEQKVVVLIDEYDKPIIDFITDPVKAKENREILRNFYSVLKSSDQYLQFVFLTGVSKFSKISVFSGLNNIKDITLSNRFSTILGVTEEELRENFKNHIAALSKIEDSPQEELLQDIKNWYNGYSWDGINKLYNPTSLLNLFYDNQFDNYWFATGTPTFLIKTMTEYNYQISDVEETIVGQSILESYEIDNIDVNALLLQTGYLTIKKVNRLGKERYFVLGCPNFEVKNSLLNYIMADYMKEPASRIKPQYMMIIEALMNKDLETFITIIKSMFAKIPYNLHLKDEAYYHSLFYLMLALMGVKINLEVLTDKGRMDGVLELDELVYVIELKRGTPQEAIDQIDDRRYYESYLDSGKEIFLLGIGGFDEKNINYICKNITV